MRLANIIPHPGWAAHAPVRAGRVCPDAGSCVSTSGAAPRVRTGACRPLVPLVPLVAMVPLVSVVAFVALDTGVTAPSWSPWCPQVQ